MNTFSVFMYATQYIKPMNKGIDRCHSFLLNSRYIPYMANGITIGGITYHIGKCSIPPTRLVLNRYPIILEKLKVLNAITEDINTGIISKYRCLYFNISIGITNTIKGGYSIKHNILDVYNRYSLFLVYAIKLMI